MTKFQKLADTLKQTGRDMDPVSFELTASVTAELIKRGYRIISADVSEKDKAAKRGVIMVGVENDGSVLITVETDSINVLGEGSVDLANPDFFDELEELIKSADGTLIKTISESMAKMRDTHDELANSPWK